MYAAGKIPGGFFKREGRPTERAILTARMIDRPIRPLWPKGYRNEVQCIATVLSADLVTPHDILAINGISAALMVSPMPFLGPIGAVRIGLSTASSSSTRRCRRRGRVDELDLIVVGTKDGLTMVEAGANQIPEERLLEALDLAQREIVKLCEAQEELREQGRQAEVARPGVTEELERPVRRRDRHAHPRAGPPRGAPDRRGDRRDARPARSRWTSTEDDIVRELQARMSLARSSRSSARPPSRARCASSSRATCAALTEAEQDSKELKSAKRHLLFDRIVDTVQLPFPGGGDGRRAVQDSLTKQLRQEGVRVDLQEPRPAEDRRRQAAARRPHARRRSARSRSRCRRQRRARTARASSPAGRRRS